MSKQALRYVVVFLFMAMMGHTACHSPAKMERPLNFIVIYTDDQRGSAIGYENSEVFTPNLDRLAGHGVRFTQAYVTLSICSPSRATLLTGKYPSAHGVTTYGKVPMNPGIPTLPQILKRNGYHTAIIGKWHLGTSPRDAGFEKSVYFESNGKWYDRQVIENGMRVTAHGFIEKYLVDQSIHYIDSIIPSNKPFFLWHCSQLPHLNSEFEWDVSSMKIDSLYPENITLPSNWHDSLNGKPDYLATGRHKTKALSYGYATPDSVIHAKKEYFTAINILDHELGRLFDYLKDKGLMENTVIIFMGDNGWFIGDHLFTSKVLAYEESIRVPAFLVGPGIDSREINEMILNADVMPTILELAAIEQPVNLHGASLVPFTRGEIPPDWRDTLFYEAPVSQLGSRPLFALRTERYKYIQTLDSAGKFSYEELYDLKSDVSELQNLADKPGYSDTLKKLNQALGRFKRKFSN